MLTCGMSIEEIECPYPSSRLRKFRVMPSFWPLTGSTKDLLASDVLRLKGMPQLRQQHPEDDNYCVTEITVKPLATGIAEVSVFYTEKETESEPEIRFIEQSFQLVTVGKDDVIVLMHEGVMSEEASIRLLGGLKRGFPGHKCILLQEGMKIGVVHEV